MQEKKKLFRLGNYLAAGYQIIGKHLIRENRDGSKTIVLFYEQNLMNSRL
jgi:hypothetical protein